MPAVMRSKDDNIFSSKCVSKLLTTSVQTLRFLQVITTKTRIAWQIFKKKKKVTLSLHLQTNSTERVHTYAHTWTDRLQFKMSPTAGERLQQRWQLSPVFSGSGSAEAATDVPLNALNVRVCVAINRSVKADEKHTLRRTQPAQQRSVLGTGTNPQLNALFSWLDMLPRKRVYGFFSFSFAISCAWAEDFTTLNLRSGSLQPACHPGC